MLLDADDSQLVLVDYQPRLMPAIHEGPLVLANAVRLAKLAHAFDVPVWGTEQNPDKLGAHPPELRDLCRRTLAKMHFSAVADGLAAVRDARFMGKTVIYPHLRELPLLGLDDLAARHATVAERLTDGKWWNRAAEAELFRLYADG